MIKLSNDPVTTPCVADGDPKTVPCLCAADAEPDGCTCTDTVHPQTCVCDPDITAAFTGVACLATKICTAYNQPGGCSCAPITDTTAIYANAKCEADKLFMAKPVCTETVLVDCRCTEAQQPSGCECPPDDVLDSTYTKTKCEADTGGGSGPTPGTDIGDCTSETLPDEGCICVKDFHPKDCTCPDTAEKLKDLTKEVCACLDTGDLRDECKEEQPDTPVMPAACVDETVPVGGCKCVKEFQPKGCTCPTEPKELEFIEKEICECPKEEDKVKWDADPRTKKGGICSAGSMRIKWAVIASALLIPALALW
ncbi:MAG: hypothetical protein EZS28_020996 [Streblomastix strix]|uniref:Uncharacterized protein n=1 Tax=Streblomastix strix TaxID=222440 RepID=A0A5J4VLK5_9EUKA|nr:MAG: hypothetical protein EZS28_020996 [Streblomastix strix]